MKRTFDTLTILLCVVFVLQTLSSQNANSQTIQKKFSGTAKNIRSVNNSLTPLPAGTYTVGTGSNYPTLDDAFFFLSVNGISGPVTLSLTDTLYDATTNFFGSFELVGPISGAGSTNRITIRPADNVVVTIKGNGDAVLLFQNVSYLTIDGVSLVGNTRMKVHALYNAGFSYNEGIEFIGNCDFNIIQNLTACTDDISRQTDAIGFYSSGGAPDNCLISDVAVTSGMFGIWMGGSSNTRPTGNVLRNNHIGSPSDSLIACGIGTDWTDGTIIENNHVENLRLSVPENNQSGIYAGSNRNTIIRNNLVHNICNTINSVSSQGILAGGYSRGVNCWIYNNKVWDMKNRAALNDISGIRAYSQDSVRIEYNTVYLSECGDVPPTGFSQALGLWGVVYPTVRNNILVNTRDDNTTRSTAIEIPSGLIISDYNDLYVDSGANAFVGRYNTSNYKTFANWKTTGKDVHSVSICPIFCTSVLHIDTTNVTSNSLDGKGIPIAGILTDFEGQARHATTPDIGADEFDITLGITKEIAGVPEIFALSQNYPNPFNPTTTIRYSLPTSANVKLVIYDLLGREIATLVNEEQSAGWKEVQWNAKDVSSGIYFYRVQAKDFIDIKKLLFLK